MNIAKKSLLLCIICALISNLSVIAAENVLEDNVSAILEKMPENNSEPVWGAARELSALDDDVEDLLTEKLQNAEVNETIAISYALMSMGSQREAALALETIILDDSKPIQRRLDACAVLGSEGGGYAKARLRSMLKNEELADIVKVAVAANLWKLSYAPVASKALVDIANNSESFAAAAEAALALGRFGRYDDARELLEKLAENPGEIGDEAAALLKLDSKYSEKIKRDVFAEELIAEVIEKIRTRYAFDTTDPDEAEQLKAKNLASTAARKLVRSLDDFNDYLDEEDYQEMLNNMHGDYGGIGAYVGKRNELFTILSPMWGKPAYKAGLKAMDVITEIDDVDVTDMELSKIIKRLKGEPGVPVKVKVMRAGWEEPREMIVQREMISLPMVYSQMLPGDIGYVLLTGFQEDPYRKISTSSELHKALVKLEELGMKGLILDLRNNPGGLLSEAVKVAEEFLERNKLIVYSKGKISKQRNYESRILGKPTYTGPMVVLVNGGSASASEIVSGALRDHNRATLVGQKTFGKGSVQMLLPVETTGGNTRLKLTIAKYYLPGGECIHGRDKGIKPHIEQEEEEFSKAERELRLKQLENRDIAIWLEKYFDNEKEEFMALLEYDNNNPQAYPHFDELYGILLEEYPDIKFDKDIVRKELRAALFNFVRESRGIEDYPADIQRSEALKRAIAVMGEKIGGLPAVPVYDEFKDRWSNQENEQSQKNDDSSIEKEE